MYLCALNMGDVMKELKLYTIQYVGLKEGAHTFEYDITKSFFELFEYEDLNEAAIKADVLLTKKSTFMEFNFKISGTINVNCDVTNEPYDENIAGDYDLVVKFGEDYNDDFEDIVILPYGEYEFNVAQYIYELIILSTPNKLVHPGVVDGTLKSDILEKLEELSIPDKSEETKKENTDPRWDDLKKLLTDK